MDENAILTNKSEIILMMTLIKEKQHIKAEVRRKNEINIKLNKENKILLNLINSKLY